MKKTLRGKLTYSNVISTLCLFLLLGGGTAFAANQLAKNSVGSKQLKKGAVTPEKLSPASKATLTGPTGPQGVPGARGAAGATKVTKLTSEIESDGEAQVSCPSGEVATGGGGSATVVEGFLYKSEPLETNGTPTGWEADAEKAGTSEPVDVYAYVICASP